MTEQLRHEERELDIEECRAKQPEHLRMAGGEGALCGRQEVWAGGSMAWPGMGGPEDGAELEPQNSGAGRDAKDQVLVCMHGAFFHAPCSSEGLLSPRGMHSVTAGKAGACGICWDRLCAEWCVGFLLGAALGIYIHELWRGRPAGVRR